MPSYQTFNKQPVEVLDYDIDFTQYFDPTDLTDGVPSAASVVVAVDHTGIAPDLVVDTTKGASGITLVGSAPVRLVKVWLKGGVSGTTYKVSLTTTTIDGRVIDTDFKVRVQEL